MTDKESAQDKEIYFNENFNLTKYLIRILDELFISIDLLFRNDMPNCPNNIIQKIYESNF